MCAVQQWEQGPSSDTEAAPALPEPAGRPERRAVKTTPRWEPVRVSLSAVCVSSTKGILKEDENKMRTFHLIFKTP